MESCRFNDEEEQIMKDLEGLPEPEQIGILQDSLAGETEKSGQCVLRTLISKLRAGQRPTSG